MVTLVTPEAVSYVRDRLNISLRPSLPLITQFVATKSYSYNAVAKYSLYYHLEPSLESCRRKIEDFLGQLFALEEGSSKDYIFYTAKRSGGKVKVKALPRRIKSITALHNLDSLISIGEVRPERKISMAIMDITFLRCLFSLGSKWNKFEHIDLSKAALPQTDVKARVGDYHLLYDKITKEWSIWMK